MFLQRITRWGPVSIAVAVLFAALLWAWSVRAQLNPWIAAEDLAELVVVLSPMWLPALPTANARRSRWTRLICGALCLGISGSFGFVVIAGEDAIFSVVVALFGIAGVLHLISRSSGAHSASAELKN